MPGEMPSSWLRPKRSTVVIIALAALAINAFLLLSMPRQGVLDLRVFYTPAGALEFIGALDDSQRAVYRLFCSFDFAFIFIYTLMLITWVRFVRNRAASPRWIHPIFAVVPALFDLAETISAFMLLDDPSRTSLAWVAAFATPLKWAAGVAIAAVILKGEVRWFRSRRARKRAARSVK
jgi:hypothetical protein